MGDALLIRGDRRPFFLGGLAAFLAGHLAYLVAFLTPVFRTGLASPWLLATVIPLCATGAVVYRALRPGLAHMKGPVVVYMAAILGMVLASLLHASRVGGAGSWLPVLGALTFAISDTLLALRRFRGPIRFGHVLVAVTYITAQTLIVAGFLLGERAPLR